MYAIHARGAPGASQVVFRYQSEITRRVTEYYAERGLIAIHHENADGTEQYERVPRREFLRRALAVSGEIRYLRLRACRDAMQARGLRREAWDKQNLVECMIAAARAAGGQGDPLDPRATFARPSRPVAPGADFELTVPPMPAAPPDKPPADMGGTQVLDARRQLVIATR